MQKLLGYMRAAIDKYNMINENDKIAVGVSGGKDSLILLYALNKLKKFYPVNFEIVAITIDPCFNSINMDTSKIKKFCDSLGVEYIIKNSNLGNIVFKESKVKSPCSLCSRMRRGILHNIAKEHSCTRLALGHHFDDAVETFFMNLLNGGKIGCFSPVSYLSRKDLFLIRPMIFCKEKDILSVSTKYNLPVEKSSCPVDGKTQRQVTKELIKSLENSYPDIKQKVLGAMKRANIDNWGLKQN